MREAVFADDFDQNQPIPNFLDNQSFLATPLTDSRLNATSVGSTSIQSYLAVLKASFHFEMPFFPVHKLYFQASASPASLSPL